MFKVTYRSYHVIKAYQRRCESRIEGYNFLFSNNNIKNVKLLNFFKILNLYYRLKGKHLFENKRNIQYFSLALLHNNNYFINVFVLKTFHREQKKKNIPLKKVKEKSFLI